MTDVIFLILAAVIGIGAGVAIGILFASSRSDKPYNQDQTKSQPNLIETVKIWQDRKSGNLFPEMNGKIIRFPADLSHTQRERLIGQLTTLLSWLKAGFEAKEAPPPVAAPSTGVPFVQDHLTSPTTSTQTGKFSPIDLVARAVQPETRPPLPEKSMVAQIDEILQEKLNTSPLAGQGIRLIEHPTQGLVVMVGLNRYEGVDEVPDPEIRSLIRESVAEWEQRSGTT